MFTIKSATEKHIMDNYGQKFSFDRILVIVVVFLFLFIILVSLYLFDIISIPGFSSSQNNSQAPKIASDQKQNATPKTPEPKSLLHPSPVTFANDTDKWMTKEIPNSDIKILSSLHITANMLVVYKPNAPSSSTTGIIFDNGLQETDENLRQLSIFYYLQNKRWVLKFQAGDQIKYYPIIDVNPEKVYGIFKIVVSPEGNSVEITINNKETKTYSLPSSLYEISNQMNLKAQIGPNSSLTFMALSYDPAQ